jgi:ribosome biogenesis protein
MTASYDGTLRLFDYSQKPLHSVPLHAAPITSFCILPASSASNDPSADVETHLIATASHDLTARLTRLTIVDSNVSTVPQATLHLHTAPLSSIAASPTGSHILTASWDGLLGVWDTSVPDIDEVALPVSAVGERKKRRRVDAEDQTVKRKAPHAILRSHVGRVSAVLWRKVTPHAEGTDADNAHAVSCGFDSTVRLWDVEHQICVHTIVRPHLYPELLFYAVLTD